MVATHNLAYGVFVGVLLSGMFFANKIAQYKYVKSDLSDDGRLRVYQVIGQVFYASSYKFTEFFDFKEVLDKVVIDLSEAHFWDISAVAASIGLCSNFAAKAPRYSCWGSTKPAPPSLIVSPCMTNPNLSTS